MLGEAIRATSNAVTNIAFRSRTEREAEAKDARARGVDVECSQPFRGSGRALAVRAHEKGLELLVAIDAIDGFLTKPVRQSRGRL